MGLYFNGKKVRNLYYNGKCITRLALGKGMTRLVEGDDFVRAKWLVGDGSAYIDTNINPNFNDELNVIATASATPTVPNIGFIEASDGNTEITIGTVGDWYSTGVPQFLVKTRRRGTAAYTEWGSGAELGYDIKVYNISAKVIYNTIPTCNLIANGVDYGSGSVIGDNTITSVPASSYKFCSYTNTSGVTTRGLNTAKLNQIRINNHTFVPCRLLRPIPATLDANGIARNADECGMYNSVNGLFYGNVGSGTFTVSDN